MRRFITAGVAAALAVIPLQATSTIPTDLDDVVATATLIVRGRVVDARAFTEMANGPVMTAVTIATSEVLKGSAGASVTFRVHGGEIGRYRYVVVGSPTFVVGDEAYFFLKRTSAGALWPVGMSAGVYRVSGTVRAPVVAGITATAGTAVQRGDIRRKPMAPGEFESLVRLMMNTAGTSSPMRGRK
ncbi:MAG: hypothetical protein EPO35_03615 [Acidobacteria bacterium]|nr:MAG: hypothetical protein EPO35_03615 [Acidobacteriota bacterium]